MKKELQQLLDTAGFLRPYGFRVVTVGEEKCTLELPHRADLERPGGIINGPALMAAADCAMWLAIKARIGLENDALTSDRLMHGVATAARDDGLKITPICGYAAAWLRRHREYADLLA